MVITVAKESRRPGTAWRARGMAGRFFGETGSAAVEIRKTIRVSNLWGLSVEERLRLAEDLWDTIAEVPQALPLTDAERVELDRRLAAYSHDPCAGPTWDEVRQRIQRPG